jgi:hypothetical protein
VIATLKEVRDEASNLYVDLQSALLRASVKHYLMSDGTLWDSMPLKKELRDATYGMAFALVLIVNQVLSHATPSVQAVRPKFLLKQSVRRVHSGGLDSSGLLHAPSTAPQLLCLLPPVGQSLFC